MAEIVKLHDLNDEEGQFRKFLEELKEGTKRAIFFITDGKEQIKLGCTAQNPAELIIMLHHLKKYNEYLVDTYSGAIFDAEEEDEEDGGGDYVN